MVLGHEEALFVPQRLGRPLADTLLTKRSLKNSKLEELAAEVRNIKEAVAPRPIPPILNPAPVDPQVLARPVQLPSPHSNPPSLTTDSYLPPRANSFVRLNPFIAPAVPETDVSTPALSNDTTLTLPAPSGRPTEPRALGSRVFSGDDIDYYFEKYAILLSSLLNCKPLVKL